ncbi:hypothetical protein WT15_20225 [Burkholderia stagnalis]|uniref:tetratricopeptide repeat protein n=1 Tax=Burkholderia stagnalis TaxID=1503054 RepID=UPI0007567D90|nr:tetratricopeptide repeat protein [Burkholderia stagnalis]AOK56543.1 hypothetical protein WT74_28120 [Burkholderia stagnalis]KVN76076.1 hypothetical protein WT15_20225 [Burkholderia stagnalis]KWO32037.1 hypothetical protein WT96_22750 [Burkholderia stagnalis]KWO32138.1 hypothetical protein WT95_00680 [Burkholderia stagnalis]
MNIYGDRNVVSVSLADPQVKAIVDRLTITSTRIQKRQKGQDNRLSELGRQMDNVTQAVASIVAESRQPHADNFTLETVSLLSAGRVESAQKVLKAREDAVLKSADHRPSDGSTPRQRAAELALDQAALASLSDTQTAIEAYKRASQYEPDNPWTLLKLGDLQMDAGRPSDALDTFEKAKTIARQQRSPTSRAGVHEHELSAALLRTGDAMSTLGENDRALEQYHEGLKASDRFDDASPDFTGLLWARAALHQRIGDAYVTRGDGDHALSEYDRSVQIRKRIVAARPSNVPLALGLASAHQKIGELFTKQRKYKDAFQAFTEAESALPASTEADLDAVNNRRGRIYERWGVAKYESGDLAGARESYLKALSIQKSLVAKDGENAEWQRELASTHIRIGDLEMRQRRLEKAEANYTVARLIYTDLAKIDPKNKDFKRLLAISERKVGVALSGRKESERALEPLHRSIQLSEELIRETPTNAEWRADLAITYWRLGSVARGQSIEDRMKYLKMSIEIFNYLESKGQLWPSEKNFADQASDELEKLRASR